MGNSIAKVSDDTIRIQDYLERLEPGMYLAYTQISAATGVFMDEHGKQLLRSALHRAELEYTCIRGEGIELASPINGVSIIATRLDKIGNAVRRGSRTQRTIQDKFWEEMVPEDQKKVLFTGAVFGAIQAAAKSMKALTDKSTKRTATSLNIPLPEIAGVREL